MANTPTPVTTPAPGTITRQPTPPSVLPTLPPTRTDTRDSEKEGLLCRIWKILKKLTIALFWISILTLFLTNYRDAFPESAAKFPNVYTFVDNYMAPVVEAWMGLVNTICSCLKGLWQNILGWIKELSA